MDRICQMGSEQLIAIATKCQCKKTVQRQIARYSSNLTVLGSHALEPGQPQVGRILITFGDAIHQVNQHLRVFLKLLHLDCIREDHVQVEHQVSHLNTCAQVQSDIKQLPTNNLHKNYKLSEISNLC